MCQDDVQLDKTRLRVNDERWTAICSTMQPILSRTLDQEQKCGLYLRKE